MLLATALRLLYLHNHPPIDLSGDEAQYWDWSRQLDLSYYSKGPLVAYLIRASCALFEETMPAVRLPAVLLGTGTQVIIYLLVLKLFQSDRLALGAVLLNLLAPMYLPLGMLMTIDAPLFFCWALATYFVAIAIFGGKPLAWIGVGVATGIGFLAKYAMFLWFLPVLAFLSTDRLSRKRLKTWGPWASFLVACLFTLPVIVWNARHDWVSMKHVGTQTGAAKGGFDLGNVAEALASPLLLAGPLIAFVIAGVVYAIREKQDPHRRQLLLLTWIGLTFVGFCLLSSLRAKMQLNWPAPGLLTLLIVGAYFLGTRLRSWTTWKPWRGWFIASVVTMVVVVPVLHGLVPIPGLIGWINRQFGTSIDASRLDPLSKARGWEELGREVSLALRELGPDAFVVCDSYMQTALMAFYVEGQPKTYCAGPYYTVRPSRHSQYDLWPDRRLDDPKLLGRDAIFVGKGGPLPAGIEEAFERMEKDPARDDLDIIVDGVKIKTFRTWRCYGFKGMRLNTERY